MYIPDRIIVRKIKQYDPKLSVVWNNKTQWWEVWREQTVGSALITPVTMSIYGEGDRVYAPLDERILWWLHSSDSWRAKSTRDYALMADSRWKEFIKGQDKARRQFWRDMGKDMYRSANYEFMSRGEKKNSKNPYKTVEQRYSRGNRWVAPDQKKVTSNRLFGRTKANAKAYNYQAGI